MATVAEITPDMLLRMPDRKNYELVHGSLLERNVSVLSCFVATKLIGELLNHVDEHGLGYVFGSDCGFQCFPHDPSQVRRPDVAFVAKSRMSTADINHGWSRIAPDLAVEVISPNDRVSELEAKLGDYREAGIPVVWVVDPEARTAYVHRLDAGSEYLVDDVELVGEGPLDGFRCKLADLLPSDA